VVEVVDTVDVVVGATVVVGTVVVVGAAVVVVEIFATMAQPNREATIMPRDKTSNALFIIFSFNLPDRVSRVE